MRTLILLIFFILTLMADPFANEALLQKADAKYGAFAKNRFINMNKTLEELKDKSRQEQLEGVNDLFNAVGYSSDMKLYGKSDHWATPWEFLGKDQGDCEDYVIAKYFALKHLGVPSKKLYFSYVRSTRFKEPHMVLTYFETPDAVPLVLDNINFRVFPATKRKDLIPIYNFNADILQAAKEKKKLPKTHKKWDRLIENIQRNRL